jgi:hypothetical protein
MVFTKESRDSAKYAKIMAKIATVRARVEPRLKHDVKMQMICLTNWGYKCELLYTPNRFRNYLRKNRHSFRFNGGGLDLIGQGLFQLLT